MSGDVGLPELLEAAGRLVRRHPDAEVGHADADPVAVGCTADDDGPVGGRVGDGVAEQVVEDGPQRAALADDRRRA